MHSIVLFAKSRFTWIKTHKKRALLLLIPLIILTFIFWPRPQKPIETQRAKYSDIVESLSATGAISSDAVVDLKFLGAGKLTSLNVKKGDHVKMGQIIATLDQRSVQKNVETQLRAYAKQRETFEQTKKDNQNRTPQEALNDDMKRILQDNQYDLEDAVASLELQDLIKQQAVLVSPINGIVIAEDVTTPGVNVTTATTITIADPNQLTFKIDIDEADIGKIKIGQKTKVVLDAFPEKEFTLQVKAIDFAAHATSTGGNVYTVEVAIPENSDLQYRIGMNGDADIIIREKKNVLTIPLSSLADDTHIYVKIDKKFIKKSVTTGLQNDTDVEITSGLTEGDEVAIDPAQAEKVAKK